ncbi:MAG: GGDEF domain-containing protein [Lachnospiraceae bacterium]|nr:GGDEF domain-containing protein [Lachnospiraceae bacterium]
MKKKIAIFTTGWGSEILSQFLTGMQDALRSEQADLFLFLCYPTYIDTLAMKRGEMNIFTLPDLHDFDGAVIFGSGLDFKDRVDDIIARSKKAGIPVIMQGSRREGISFVGSDNYQATKNMCEHLTREHGVKRISFFAGTTDSLDSELRLKAVRDYLEENDRSEDLTEVFYTKWENAAVTRHVNEICAEGAELPDVFICANDGLAMECCVTLSNNSYEVPKDVLVCGYDHIDDSQVFDPSISSVDQCFTEMGAAAGKLWLELMAGAEPGKTHIIPCQFIPGDSCGCYETRNSDKMRRRKGREAFSKRAMTTYFNRKLNLIDSTILSCLTYQDFKRNLHRLLAENHDYEGDSFHILLEPNFGLSIYDPNIRLNTKGYSKQLEVLYSTEDGVSFKEDRFSSSELIPGYDPEGPNHLYVFLPLHEADEAYGYIIFRDCMEKVENHFLHTYQSRMGLVFDKFRHALSLDLINKRLLDLMRRDPLTNVNNRMAYEDKEKYIQSKINSETASDFAIAMFDVNNLKLVNDSFGHDAGDEYLIRACHLICNIFKHSPVYRVGGDEFIAILSGNDFEDREHLKEDLDHHMSPYSNRLPLPSDYVSIACGISVYVPGKDMSVQDVVKRADEEMYRVKALMKQSAS